MQLNLTTNFITKCLIGGLIFAFVPTFGSSDKPDEQPIPSNIENAWSFSFYFENDLFSGTDRNYTNGTKFTWISGDLSDYRDDKKLPKWLYNAIQLLPFINEPGIQRNVAFSIGQNIYTPDNIENPNLIPNDRPYAAWLYTGFAFHNKTEHWLDTIEINLGVVGPMALGEEIQNFVHRTRNLQTAEGWDNQIKNEPVLNLVWERKYRWVLVGNHQGFGMDVFSHVGASLGNLFTYANTGGGLRFGWNLPQDFGASLIRLAGDANAPASANDLRIAKHSPFSIHFFAAVDGRLIARDLTLDGNSWKDSHSIDKEEAVGDFSFGVGAVLKNWKFSYALTLRSATYENAPRHEFGSINITFTY